MEYLATLQRRLGMQAEPPFSREAAERRMPDSFQANFLEQAGGDEDRAREMADQFFGLLEKADAARPTPYEDAWTYYLMSSLASQTEAAAAKILEQAPAMPPFGTLPLGQLNAMAMAVPDSSESLIAFQHGVFGFANLVSKAVAASFPVVPNTDAEDGVTFSTDLEIVERRFAEDDLPLRRLDDFLAAYLVAGHPHAAAQYFLEMPYSRLAEMFLNAFELFIFSHELGHVVAGHVDARRTVQRLTDHAVEPAPPDWKRELEADYLGTAVAVAAMREREIDFALGYCGIDLVFSAIELVDRALSTLRYGEVREAPISATHPPAQLRRESSRHWIAEFAGEEGPGAIDLATTSQRLLELMWDRLQPGFEERHRNGVRPHPSWQAAA